MNITREARVPNRHTPKWAKRFAKNNPAKFGAGVFFRRALSAIAISGGGHEMPGGLL